MYYLLTILLFFSLAQYNTADLSKSYLNHQCEPKDYSKPFKCPELNSDVIRVDVATFYQPIPRECLINCSVIPAYDKKVIYNKDWIILLDWSAAYRVNPLFYNPYCYPKGTFVVDGNIPVSLLRDRISFDSQFDYVIKKGAPLVSFLPIFGHHDDVSLTIKEKEFLMFLSLFLMKNVTDYDHVIHQKDNNFYDMATDGKLKDDGIDISKAQKLLHNIYFDNMEMLIESTEVEWHRLCEDASLEKGQFYEEVMAGMQ